MRRTEAPFRHPRVNKCNESVCCSTLPRRALFPPWPPATRVCLFCLLLNAVPAATCVRYCASFRRSAERRQKRRTCTSSHSPGTNAHEVKGLVSPTSCACKRTFAACQNSLILDVIIDYDSCADFVCLAKQLTTLLMRRSSYISTITVISRGPEAPPQPRAAPTPP